MNHNRELENVRDRFKRHRIQQSMTGDPALFLCDDVAASLGKRGNFLLESSQDQFMRAEDEQAWSSRRFLSPPQAEQARRPVVPLGSTG